MRKSVQYYDRDRRKGRKYSAVLHLLVLLLLIFGLPNFMMPRPPAEPMAVTVEILPISEMSNVKPSAQQPQEQKPEESKTIPKEAPPVQVADDTPPPPPSEASILPKPTPAPTQAPKPKPKPKPKDDLAAVLKAVKETAQKEKAKVKTELADDNVNQSRSTHYDPGLPMSMSEIDAIRSQIAKCWNVPSGARNAQDLVVMLRLQLAPDGSLLKVELARESESRYGSDSFFRAAADSARRAVQECSPLKNLPADKYATWRDMEMTFDPKEMLF